MSAPRIHALIPAAGHSIRFGGTTLKQYAHLIGLPVMAHSIEAVMANAAIKSVTVALAPDDGIFDELVQPSYPAVNTVTGGSSRARTVMNGLEFIAGQYPDCEWILVHDAARPCLATADLDRLLEQGLESDVGAILAMPVSDTLKLADESAHIEQTIDRSRYWAAQTPQLFPFRLLHQQLTDALADGVEPTDEASAIERGGFRPLLVKGSSTNIKITGAEDLALAEFILQRQAVRE